MAKTDDKTPKSLPLIDLVINDESVVNDRGYNVLNSGLNDARYNNNPIMLYMHDVERPIAMCRSRRIEGSKLIGSFEFDAGDALAVEVHRKLTSGYIRGASAGFFIESMTYGGDHDTVDKWELLEVSIVTIPANRNAVKLYSKEGVPLTDEEGARYLETLRSNYNQQDTMTTTTQTTAPQAVQTTPTPETLSISTEAREALGLSHSATLADLNQAVVNLSRQYKELQETVETARQARRDALIAQAVQEGRITADKQQQYLALYDANPDLCASTLADLPARQTLSGQVVNKGKGVLSNRYDGTWTELDRKGLLAELKANDPDTFRAKFREHFGVDYKD